MNQTKTYSNRLTVLMLSILLSTSTFGQFTKGQKSLTGNLQFSHDKLKRIVSSETLTDIKKENSDLDQDFTNLDLSNATIGVQFFLQQKKKPDRTDGDE